MEINKKTSKQPVNQLKKTKGLIEHGALERDIDRPDGLRKLIRRNMAEYRRVIEEVQDSEQKYRNIVENSPDLLYIVDPQWVVTSINKAAKTILGYEPEEVIGHNFMEFISDKTAEQMAKDYRQILTGEKIANEVMITRKDGGERYLEFISVPIIRDGIVVEVQGFARDVTHRMHMEEKIRRSEEYFRLIIENISNVVIITDASGAVKYVSPSIKSVLGYEPEDILGRSHFELIHPEDISVATDALNQAVAAGFKGYLDFRVLHKNSSWRTVRAALSDLLNNPSVTGFVIYLSDITEIKRAEAEIAGLQLKQSEKQLATFMEKCADGVVVLVDGLVEFVNSKGLEEIGFSLEEVRGKPFLDFVSPPWREQVMERYRKRLNGEEVPNIYEIALLGRDGSEIPVEINASLVEYDGKPATLSMVRDITERKKAEEALKESEERFLKAFHMSQVGMAISHLPEGRWVDVNDSFLHMLEYTREEVIGRTSVELNMILEADERAEAIDDVVRKGCLRDREFHLRTKTGKLLTVLSSSDKIKLKGQDHAITVVLDITERKKIEQLKDEFIGMVSHEIRSPLTVIIGSLRTAKMPGLSQGEVSELLDNATESANVLNEIVENLLELSRYQAGYLKIDARLADLGEVVRNTTDGLLQKFVKHQLIVDLSQKLPEIPFDPVRVERILHNLIDNAIKYSPKGGEVKISVRSQDGSLVVCVSDQGLGILPEDQKRLFQRFQRLDSRDRRKIQGIGLGLSVCLALVESHGGQIWVKSEPGKGSKFCFTLPFDGKSGRREGRV